MLWFLQRTWIFFRIMSPGILLGAVLFLVRRGLIRRRASRLKWYSPPLREGAMLLFCMFCGGMAFATLTPGGFDLWAALRYGYSRPFFSLGTVNLIPFRTFNESLYILLGNIVMFLPFGFFAALLWRGYHWRRAIVTGVAITGFIECWQLLVGRAFDIDDLMLNTFGVLCGYWLWLALSKGFPRALARFHVTTQKGEIEP